MRFVYNMAALLLTVPHMWYAYIYKTRDAFGMTPEQVGTVATGLRAGAYACTFGYAFWRYGWLPVGTAPRLVAGASLLASGQWLNMEVYHKLGARGVYYGRELGFSGLPGWQHGFPFTIPHPQYTGAAITTVGLMLLWGFDALDRPRWELLALGIWTTTLYGFSAWVESG